MRIEKKYISDEYLGRLQASPFFILVDYQGLTVKQFTELRQRLGQAGSEIHVVKNSLFRIAATESGFEIAEPISGQAAAVTGEGDISATAKTLKTFAAEFNRPKFRFGYLDQERFEADQLIVLADLPPLDQMRAKLAGLIQMPAGNLVRLLNTPASQLARVLQARLDKEPA